jgi:hypothetical protein
MLAVVLALCGCHKKPDRSAPATVFDDTDNKAWHQKLTEHKPTPMSEPASSGAR